MGTGNLTDRSSGQTILDTFFNDIHSAMDGDFVGRNSSGAPTSGQNLGTTAIPWGTLRAASLVLNGASVDTSQLTAPVNRVISGKVRSTSNQPAYITPNGAALSLIVSGSATNLVLDVNGTSVTVATDITKSSLTAAPSSANTCLLNDNTAAAQADTRLWGEPEHTKVLVVDTMGSEISNLVGKYAAFKVAGGATEYFIAFVESATSLTKVRRGFFYDSALAPINRTTLTDNDVITLMKWGFVFVENNGTTVDVTYTVPTWSFDSPSSPATGDYWYDLANKIWKRYDGASFVSINRNFIGSFISNTTQTVGARCVDFYAKYTDDNTIGIEIESTSIVRGNGVGQMVDVAGQRINFGNSLPKWNITTDLATTPDAIAAEAASTLYYLYVKDTGDTILSDIAPYYRDDLLGQYHPHNPWRCVGSAYNDGSSNIINASAWADGKDDSEVFVTGHNIYGATLSRCPRFVTETRNVGTSIIYSTSSASANNFLITRPGRYGGGHLASGATSGAQAAGFSLNSTQGGTAIESITAANRLSVNYMRAISGTFVFAETHFDRYLKIGDVIRAHDSDNVGTSTDIPYARLVRIR